jgi:hypothetical protein
MRQHFNVLWEMVQWIARFSFIIPLEEKQQKNDPWFHAYKFDAPLKYEKGFFTTNKLFNFRGISAGCRILPGFRLSCRSQKSGSTQTLSIFNTLLNRICANEFH